MLIIVMAKPIDVTMVKAVPLFCTGAVCAISVENWGESAMTELPHINKKDKKNNKLNEKIKGETKQQIPERSNE